jgi:uncharacterized protein with PhoU and TrkA domain
MLRPQVVSVLDAMLRERGAVRVGEGTQRHAFNPGPDRRLQAGDVLIVCADPHRLDTLRKIVTEG